MHSDAKFNDECLICWNDVWSQQGFHGVIMAQDLLPRGQK